MNFRQLIITISIAFASIIAVIDFLHRQEVTTALFLFITAFVISFFIINKLFEKFIYKRIRTIYRLIHNLKLGKDLRDALGENIGDDPIGDAEKEVSDWARQKTSEIDTLKIQAQFRKEFLSNISHEFKTPLFATQGYIETLLDGMMEDDPETAKNFLEKASRNLDRLSYLIQDLDEISKLESGRIAINIDKFDMQELIDECIEDLEDKANSNNILLVHKTKSNHPVMVKADKKKIHQVLTNLIDNSIKYGKPNGKTSVNIHQLFDQILVEVTDNGVGIEEKNLNRVFERFYRTDKSRSRDIGGSGLGLAIVKHIIEAHQQTVNIRSTEGIGTTFGFTLDKAKTN